MRKLLFESVFRRPLTERAPSPDDAAVAELATALGQAARRRLGRSLSIREVDAGSCNGCELEIHALNNAYYDVERFGLRFVASPRHADVLLVTGPVTKNMREALERTYHATPNPKWVVAVGDCARNGGLCRRCTMWPTCWWRRRCAVPRAISPSHRACWVSRSRH
jgi:Ni,Fe-hydrogenase III small subunit